MQYYLEMYTHVIKLKQSQKMISIQIQIVVKAGREEGNYDQVQIKGQWLRSMFSFLTQLFFSQQYCLLHNNLLKMCYMLCHFLYVSYAIEYS